MIAVEFEAQAESGVIRIPDQYPEFARRKVHVILMMNQAEAEPNRVPGSAKGLLSYAEDFKAPLAESELKELFES